MEKLRKMKYNYKYVTQVEIGLLWCYKKTRFCGTFFIRLIQSRAYNE